MLICDVNEEHKRCELALFDILHLCSHDDRAKLVEEINFPAVMSGAVARLPRARYLECCSRLMNNLVSRSKTLFRLAEYN